MEKIDFVLTWVNGNDPLWIAEKQKWEGSNEGSHDSNNEVIGDCRYRDMGTLRYWFRAVEKFAPWVNKVFFITCGQKPEWLNENHPKLRIVNHKDYMSHDNLPLFNSNAIEINLHRIDDLSEKFVLFNDDMFILHPVESDFFFKKKNPVLPTTLNIRDLKYLDFRSISYIHFNDFLLVNQSFDIAKTVWENRSRWFNFNELGWKEAFSNYLRFRLNKVFWISDGEHLPVPHLKSTFAEVWARYPEVLEYTSRSRFRTNKDVSHFLFCTWNLAAGRFWPVRRHTRGYYFPVSSKLINLICDTILGQRCPTICLNDTRHNDDPGNSFVLIAKAFETILPEKSAFET